MILLIFLVVISQCMIGSSEKCLFHTGKRQSPINILSNKATYQEFRPFVLENYEKFSLKTGNLRAKNTGTTLKIELDRQPGSAPPLLSGGPLNVLYEFLEMHFHWGDIGAHAGGSEHTIDGKSYPLELHMVHKNIHDYNVSESLTHENGLTVLGFKFEISDDPTLRNTAMDTLTELTKKYLNNKDDKIDKSKVPDGQDVKLINFLPFFMDEYFDYSGSLTTGDCEEAVNWIVFKFPLAIHRENLDALKTMRNVNGSFIIDNFRMPQDLFDRPLYYHGISLLRAGVLDRGAATGIRSKTEGNQVVNVLSIPGEMLDQTAPLAEWDNYHLSQKDLKDLARKGIGRTTRPGHVPIVERI